MALKIESVRDRYAKASPRLKILNAGPPGVGKTLFAATFPNVLYADAEGRLLSLRHRDVNAITITSTTVLDELRAALAQAPEVREKVLGHPVDTVVLDTVDEIARLIIKERLRSEKREAMAMADWGYLGDTLRALLRGFRNLDLNVILNVHLKSSEDSETGRVEHKPSIQGSVGEEIAAYVDEAFLMVARPMTDPATGNRTIARHLQTFPDAQHNWVKDHSGTLPQEFPVDFTTDYSRLAGFIFGDQPAPSAQPTAIPTVAAAAPAPLPTPTAAAEPAPRRGPGRPPKPKAAPAPAPPPVAAVAATPTNGTTAEVDVVTSEFLECADCHKPLDPKLDDLQIQHSKARWGVPLDRECYVARKNAKSASTATPAT